MGLINAQGSTTIMLFFFKLDLLLIIVTPSVTSDCYQHQAMLVTDDSGYISSISTQGNSVGSSECPWRIQAPEGIRSYILNTAFL